MSKRILLDVDHVQSLAERLPEVETMNRTRHQSIELRADPAHAAREESIQQGFAAGYEAGFKQGLEDARAQEAVVLESFRHELAAVVDRIEKAMLLWYDKAEHGLAELSVDIARRIIGEVVDRNPDLILPLVREAMAFVEMANRAIIRVNASDLPLIEERRAEVIAAGQSVHEVQFVGDDSLPRGSVVIETEEGVIDASVDSKAQRIFRGEAA